MREIGLCGLMALAWCGHAAAVPRADLRPTALAATRDGARLAVSVTITNRGRARARRTSTAIVTSADRSRDGGDPTVAVVATKRIAGGGQRVLRLRVRLPRAMRTGPLWVFACTDQRREVSEHRACRRVRAGTPPDFDGLADVTTCLTAAPAAATPYELRWDPAADDRTPTAELVYDIYAATSASGHDFAKPSYTTGPGAVTFTTPELSTGVRWFFVVRARDAEGNRDANQTALEGRNICRGLAAPSSAAVASAQSTRYPSDASQPPPS